MRMLLDIQDDFSLHCKFNYRTNVDLTVPMDELYSGVHPPCTVKGMAFVVRPPQVCSRR
jgi:hypothetical protein